MPLPLWITPLLLGCASPPELPEPVDETQLAAEENAKKVASCAQSKPGIWHPLPDVPDFPLKVNERPEMESAVLEGELWVSANGMDAKFDPVSCEWTQGTPPSPVKVDRTRKAEPSGAGKFQTYGGTEVTIGATRYTLPTQGAPPPLRQQGAAVYFSEDRFAVMGIDPQNPTVRTGAWFERSTGAWQDTPPLVTKEPAPRFGSLEAIAGHLFAKTGEGLHHLDYERGTWTLLTNRAPSKLNSIRSDDGKFVGFTSGPAGIVDLEDGSYRPVDSRGEIELRVDPNRFVIRDYRGTSLFSLLDLPEGTTTPLPEPPWESRPSWMLQQVVGDHLVVVSAFDHRGGRRVFARHEPGRPYGIPTATPNEYTRRGKAWILRLPKTPSSF